jgi:uncharacterized protein YbaR (Trm112 family)/SAM-dependent methyltransferase
MRPRLTNLLSCPIDRGPLRPVVWEERPCDLSADDLAKAAELGIAEADLRTDVVTGVLINDRRGLAYPVVGGIPRLLTFRCGVTDEFLQRWGDRLRSEIPYVQLADETPTPGERDVLRSFSKEWLDYEWDGERYWNVTTDITYQSMDYVLDIAEHPLNGKLVLEVGIGVGGIADNLARTQRCELVGMDLGYAVDAARRNFVANPFFHIVQASVFALPFATERFDLVYSQGVIHHTFSTKLAFDRLSELPKHGGRLYVWVYSPENESRSLTRRMLMSMERVVRPICWRLPERAQTALLTPIVPLYLVHQIAAAGKQPGGIRYGINEAMHAARDRFTPRFIHRHSNAEVSGWFEAAGYRSVRALGDRRRPDYVPLNYVTNTGVDGERA